MQSAKPGGGLTKNVYSLNPRRGPSDITEVKFINYMWRIVA